MSSLPPKDVSVQGFAPARLFAIDANIGLNAPRPEKRRAVQAPGGGERGLEVPGMTKWGAAAIALALSAGMAHAQDESTNRVDAETDWSVFQETDPVECFAVSGANPAESVNTRDGQTVEVQRGELPPTLYVAFKPTENVAAQVSFTGGAYGFNAEEDVTLVVDGTTFTLFPQNIEADGATRGWAWPSDPAQDAAIIAALKRGSEAVITSQSARGTVSQDTFSLLGFTAAVEEAERRCAS
jgi:hypothetical protein